MMNKTKHHAIIGGILFCLCFYWRYSGIPDQLYTLRDDGLITLSHARNWVDYGFVGVNPSGGRVEGFTAPVEFLLYALGYALFGLDYQQYAIAQTLLCTFLLGAMFIQFCGKRYGIVIAFGAAFLLSQFASFIEWHGSGLENPLTHVLFLASIGILNLSIQRGVIQYHHVIIVFLATISRLDSLYHIAPLLFLFTVFWRSKHRDYNGGIFALMVVGMCASFHLWRYCYFGDLLPNTAHAQNISIFERLWSALMGDQQTLHSAFFLGKNIVFKHGGILLLIELPILFFSARDQRNQFLCLLIGSLLFTCFCNPLLFGVTRLDPSRTTTHLAMVIVLMMIVAFRSTNDKRILCSHAGGIFLLMSFSNSWNPILPKGFSAADNKYLNFTHPYELCCSIDPFDDIRNEFLLIAKQEQLPRPTISNPDLGLMSWHKQFNIVDLGRIGSPIITTITHPVAFSNYFFDFAAPDIIESHGYWTCRYFSLIFNDSRFKEHYQIIREEKDDSWKGCETTEPVRGIWIRRDIKVDSISRERALINDLKEQLSINRIRTELNQCQSAETTSCLYITRTVYRFLPELKKQAHINDLTELFSTSQSNAYDTYLITGSQKNTLDEQVLNLFQ